MLAVVPPRGADLGDSMENFVALGAGGDNFSDAFAGSEDLLHEIDLDDIFIGFDDADGLPDLEVDPNEIFGDISGDGSSSYEQSTTTLSVELKSGDVEVTPGDMAATAPANPDMEDDGAVTTTETSSAAAVNADVCKGAGAPPKSSQSKKKVKVDWTPDLHRRFVQAVEQLGIEKAVPSKILEIMALEGLTRHNVASHLQKYRSHRKHLLAREAEAATWSQRRRMYGEGVRGRHGGVSAAGAVAGAGAVGNRVAAAPWLAPTMGFPPPPLPATTTAAPMHNFRPLHVWGHPTADHAMIHMWPRPLQIPSRPPLPTWVPPADHSAFWQHPHYPRGVPQVSPCLPPPPLPQQTRVAGKPISGIPPHQPIYKQESAPALRVKQLQMELLPSNETVDQAIGEILSKPWQPLPLGLKPPSTDGVLSELQRQGISSVPPSCT